MSIEIKFNMSAFDNKHENQYVLIKYTGHHSRSYPLDNMADVLATRDLLTDFINSEAERARKLNEKDS